jgi:hypothetical protein
VRRLIDARLRNGFVSLAAGTGLGTDVASAGRRGGRGVVLVQPKARPRKSSDGQKLVTYDWNLS